MAGVAGKKNRFKVRRLIKGLNNESKSFSDSLECMEAELERSFLEDDRRNEQRNAFSEMLQPIFHGAPTFFKKKKKIRNIFSRGSSKPSLESGDDVESDLRTPDSDITETNSEKRVWFSDHKNSSSVIQVCVNEQSPQKDFSFLTDSSPREQQEEKTKTN